MKKQVTTVLAAMAIAGAALTGCSGSAQETTQAAAPAETTAAETAVAETTAAEAAEAEAAEAETSEVEAASAEAANESAILVVSFGTSFNDSRDITIGAVEGAIAEAYPEYEVRRAFTSQIILDILKERDDLEIDNVTQALDRAVADGVKELVVQPTHLMNGLEYNDLLAELKEYEEDFEKVVVGEPLLMSDADFDGVITAITEATAEYDDGETAIVFMGHGTEAESNKVYGELQEKLAAAGHANYYIGTVEAAPTLDDVMAAVGAKDGYNKVVLEPLMLVAGDHANNDMAGNEEDSWKTVMTNAGYEVECLIRGLGEIEGIQKIYVDHVGAAIESLAE